MEQLEFKFDTQLLIDGHDLKMSLMTILQRILEVTAY